MASNHHDESAGNIISLFCGAGGMDLGFQQAGFQTCVAIDNWEDAVRTFNHNSENGVAIRKNIATLTPNEFLKLIPDQSSPVGLIGGPPCQGFSRGNVSADPNDPRNLLPFRYAALLKAAREKFDLRFFVFENVTGLLSKKHLPRFNRIVDRLQKAGFRVFYNKLNAANFGVPQRRHRLFIVGLNEDYYPEVDFQFPKSSDVSSVVKDAIGTLPGATFYSKGLESTDIPFHPNHWTMVPRSSRFSSSLIQNQTTGRSFRILDWEKVSPTVAYGNREIHVHPNGQRRLTILEAMLLQGFGQGFEILGNLSSQVTQVSNAVPPPMAKAIADLLKKFLATEGKPLSY